MIQRRIAAIAGFLLLIAHGVACAAADSPSPSASPSVSPLASAIPSATALPSIAPLSSLASASPSPFHAAAGTGQLVVYFVLIVALLLAGLYFTRTGFAAMPRKGKGERKLQISETRSLGNRQFLIVAEYENRKMLLGVCPGRIDYLSTLSGGGDDTFSTELPDKLE